MQTLKNDFSTVKRKGFPLYSLDLQLSIWESLPCMLRSQHSSQKPTSATCRMNVHWCEETQISKSSCQLDLLNQKDLQVLTKLCYKAQQVIDEPKKDTNLFIQSPATDLSFDQTTVLPLNALQWRVCFSTAANHTLQIDVNWHLSVCRKKREPLAKEINSCNSILCFRAHTGPHEHCQIILCGPILYLSSICAADTQEFSSCLAMTQLIST